MPRKTLPTTENEVISLILAREKYADIAVKTGVPASTIKKIKRRNYEQFETLESEATIERLESINTLVKRANLQISKVFDKAERGEVELTVHELVIVSKEMYKQSTINSSPLSPARRLQELARKYL